MTLRVKTRGETAAEEVLAPLGADRSRSLQGKNWLRLLAGAGMAALLFLLWDQFALPTETSTQEMKSMSKATNDSEGPRVQKTDEEWRKILSEEEYRVASQKGTERAFTGRYWDHHDDGTYTCVACGEPLFDSRTKFESGTGWPSFYEPVSEEHVRTETDRSLWMSRTEVLCRACDSHLGHVFEDGPAPTGLRYCMNSAALKFQPREE